MGLRKPYARDQLNVPFDKRGKGEEGEIPADYVFYRDRPKAPKKHKPEYFGRPVQCRYRISLVVGIFFLEWMSAHPAGEIKRGGWDHIFSIQWYTEGNSTLGEEQNTRTHKLLSTHASAVEGIDKILRGE